MPKLAGAGSLHTGTARRCVMRGGRRTNEAEPGRRAPTPPESSHPAARSHRPDRATGARASGRASRHLRSPPRPRRGIPRPPARSEFPARASAHLIGSARSRATADHRAHQRLPRAPRVSRFGPPSPDLKCPRAAPRHAAAHAGPWHQRIVPLSPRARRPIGAIRRRIRAVRGPDPCHQARSTPASAISTAVIRRDSRRGVIPIHAEILAEMSP